MPYDLTKPLGSDLVSDLDTILQDNQAQLAKRAMVWYVGYPYVKTSAGPTIKMPFAGLITKAIATVTTAPTGASLIVDININGTTIWSSQANRLTIAIAGTTATTTTFNTTALAANDLITLDIDQVGSTVAGVGLTIQLEFSLA
jgi:hypothetical protein